jgi:hypothetical protein
MVGLSVFMLQFPRILEGFWKGNDVGAGWQRYPLRPFTPIACKLKVFLPRVGWSTVDDGVLMQPRSAAVGRSLQA